MLVPKIKENKKKIWGKKAFLSFIRKQAVSPNFILPKNAM